MKHLAAGLGASLSAMVLLFACVGSDPDPVDDDDDKNSASSTSGAASGSSSSGASSSGGSSGSSGGSSGSSSGAPGTNLLAQGDFDTDPDNAACPYWTGNSVDATISRATPQSGAGACKVCMADVPFPGSWDISQKLEHLPVGNLKISAWIRRSGAALDKPVGLRFQLLDAAGNNVGQEVEASVNTQKADAWEEATRTVQQPTPDGAMWVALVATSDGGCFLVDAVTVTQVQ